MNIKKIVGMAFGILALSSLLVLGPSVRTAQAAVGSVDDKSKIEINGDGDFTSADDTFTSLLVASSNTVIGIITLIAGILAVLYLIWSGIQYITSSGNPEKAKSARAGIINSVIGIIIIISAFFIIRVALGIGNEAIDTTDENVMLPSVSNLA